MLTAAIAAAACIAGVFAGGGQGGGAAGVWQGRVPGRPEVLFGMFQQALRSGNAAQVALCLEDRGAPPDDPFVIAMRTWRRLPGGTVFEGRSDAEIRRAVVLQGVIRRREEFLRMRAGAPSIRADRYAVLRAETSDPDMRVAEVVHLAPTPVGWRIAETEGSPDLLRKTRAVVLERLHDCLEYCHMRRDEKPLTVKDVAAALVSGERDGYTPAFPIQDASVDDYGLLMPLAAGTPARTLVAWSITPDIEGARTVLLWNGSVELAGPASFEQMLREALATLQPGLAPLIAEARRQLETGSVQRRAVLERRIALLEGLERDAAAMSGG